jgi:hypothetical protein
MPSTALCGPCFAAAVYALNVVNEPLQGRSVSLLCSVFSGCPKLIFKAQESGLLDELFTAKYPENVHDRWLQSLGAVMTAEEVRSHIRCCGPLLIRGKTRYFLCRGVWKQMQR